MLNPSQTFYTSVNLSVTCTNDLNIKTDRTTGGYKIWATGTDIERKR